MTEAIDEEVADDRKHKLLERLIHIRRVLHENPELSMEEFETTRRIREWLLEADITVLDFPQLKTGVIAEIVGEQDGPTVALRADIDALPIQERTGLPYASKIAGRMHACGHDFHTASLIGAADLLMRRRHELKGTVRLIFQPAEETASGAMLLVEAGVLDGVSAIFGMHNKPDLPVGTIGVRPGPLMASVDRFELDVVGIGGHAGIPDQSVDPIVAASQIVSSLQSIVSRSISSLHNAVVSVCSIHGGNTWNVIPDKVTLEGTVRTFQKEARQVIPAHMRRIAEGVATAYGASADFRWFPYLPMVHNDESLAELAAETAAELGYETVVAERTLGGEDFAVYRQNVPGFFVWIGTGGTQMWHHPAFTLDERSLLVGARYLSLLGLKVLQTYNQENEKE
ncbi:amidohydrolase [Paenibacillus thalictri]|uniref:Amidohydrolase n=1 Tax=Paenibacillus thalictri TaxID=2527873 RepID=A0A4Q9DM52_9BACL|nr:amidohydrolase [Paenibacillus thalictri]TBL76385.1 amidohydrolase [Paenibacillus thalictri]